MQCDLSKFSLGVSLRNQTADTVPKAYVTNFVCIHGIYRTI